MFSLNTEERRALLFFTALILTGLGASYWLKINSKVRNFTAIYDDMFKIDINNADKETLESLPGIGEKLAQRIIDYRKVGKFKKAEDLMDIKGISEYSYKKIRDSIAVK